MSEYFGKKIVGVDGLAVGSGRVVITFEDGSYFWMEHFQDCCESVQIIDIDGDAIDLFGNTWHGYEEYSKDAGSDVSESGTYTFYTLKYSGGYIWIRWLGESNGYYSEGVSHGYVEAGEERSRW